MSPFFKSTDYPTLRIQSIIGCATANTLTLSKFGDYRLTHPHVLELPPKFNSKSLLTEVHNSVTVGVKQSLIT